MDYKKTKEKIDKQLNAVHIPRHLSYLKEDIDIQAWVTYLEGGDVVAVARAMLHKEDTFRKKLTQVEDSFLLEDQDNMSRRLDRSAPKSIDISETDEIEMCNKI